MTLPTGTVTFLMTDIEGSTWLWEQHPAAMRRALARHDALALAVVSENAGSLLKSRGEGDSLFAVFGRATDAVRAACALQQALTAENWPPEAPLRVRIALHTGEAEGSEGDYYGPAVNRCARLRGLAHGGQVLISEVTQSLVQDDLPAGAEIQNLGTHKLPGLSRAEQVFGLAHPDLPGRFPPLRYAERTPGNLPAPVSTFIGREKEKDEVRRLLDSCRLVTLVGTGGMGKSRLSLEVAAQVQETHADGAWLVELAPLSDPSAVPQAVAAALSVREVAGRSLEQALVDHLGSKTLLLVLDNCEHVLSGAASLCHELLRACASLRILASSREALGIAGETTYRMPFLSLPDLRHLPPPEELGRFEAVRLFTERAGAVAPHFGIDSRNGTAVAQICVRLDGIPLAIELAAARVRAMPVERIADRLGDRFGLLTGGSRAALPRQQTLRALIDWSYDLLGEPERALFEAVAVFASGWTLEAAERVCVGEATGLEAWQVMDVLTGLVDKSLVLYEENAGAARYRLLETVRQYALEKLTQSGRSSALHSLHRDWCVALAEEAEPHLTGPDQAGWLQRLETEHDNLRVALEWCRAKHDGDLEGLRLAGALWRFWYVRGYLSEGRGWLAEMRAQQTPTSPGEFGILARALNGEAVLAWVQGERAEARALAEGSLSLYRGLEDKPGMASAINILGILTDEDADYDQARTLYEEALPLLRDLNEPQRMAALLNNLALASLHLEDLDAAERYVRESLMLYRQVGDRQGTSVALTTYAGLEAQRGDLDAAHRAFAEALTIRRDLDDKQGIAEALEGLAGIDVAQGRPDRAANLLGAAESLRESLGFPVPPDQKTDYDRHLDAARSALSTEEFARRWDEGRSLSRRQAIEFALDGVA